MSVCLEHSSPAIITDRSFISIKGKLLRSDASLSAAAAAAAALSLLANEAKPTDHIVLSLHLPPPQLTPPQPNGA